MKALHTAMAAAFGEIESATKSAPGQVGQQKYKYADLTAVIEAIKPALIKHGLFFTQQPRASENGITVETFLHHAGGESMALGALFVPANKSDAQGFGSALTYARRYALVTAFGVPVEDDDGNAATRAAPAVKSEMPDAEWAKLAGLIKATSTNLGEMTKFFGVEKLQHLNQGQYGEAVEMLNKKLAKLAKAETDAKAQTVAEDIADEIDY